MGVFVGAMILNYLSRSILGVAAPEIMSEQGMTTEEYSWVTGAFQLGIMLQPVAGYILDVIGLKLGLALFVPLILWDRRSIGRVHPATWRGLTVSALVVAVSLGFLATASWAPIAARLPGI